MLIYWQIRTIWIVSGWRGTRWRTRIFRRRFTGSLLMRNTSITRNARMSNRTEKACKNILKLKLMLESKILTLADLTKEKLTLTKYSNLHVKDITPTLTKWSSILRIWSSKLVKRLKTISYSCRAPTVLGLRSEAILRSRMKSETQEPTRTLINSIKSSCARFSN